MREGMLYESLRDGRARCHICHWRCIIPPGKTGVCRVRRNEGGKLYLLNYAKVSSAAVDPIEKKPLFHFYPSTAVFSLGTWGCNFHCRHCQNWTISCTEIPPNADELPPERAIDLTIRYRCGGIAWTYNEPTIWFEYTYDCARLAKEKGLYTVYVTNGFITPEALDMIGPFLDAFRVDIKGFSDEFYIGLSKISKWKEVLNSTVRAKEKWNMHIEVITNIIPTMNDDDNQLRSLARWIVENLGELTPWHVTRFYPHYLLTNLPSTPISTLERAWKIGVDSGLKFVYLGNVPGHPYENTICYSCGSILIERKGYHTIVKGVEDSKCLNCGAEVNIRR